MAIYDGLKEKLAQTSQTAANKVKDLSETVRLNTNNSEIEDEISDLYGKIGYEIYLAHKDDPIPEVKDYIEQITELHKRIAENNTLIHAMQSANTCPNCGGKLKPGMVFCSSCGLKLPERIEEPEKAAFCSNCGAPVVKDAAFCTSCGAKIE